MSAVFGQTIGKAILEALGLEHQRVRSFILRCAVNEPVVIVTECLEIPNGAESADALAAILSRYHLVPKEPEEENSPT